MELDHLMWLSPDVDAGVRELTASTGVAPVLGGSHPGAGTRNALLGLGEGCYLEVYGTDPAQGGGHHNGSRIAGLPTGLLTFCCRTDRLDDAVAAAAELGLRTQGPFDSARTTLSGQTLRWRLAFLEGNVHGNGLPFLIDWMDSPHPSGTAPSGVRLAGLVVSDPDPRGLREVFAALDIPVPVQEGAPGLRADLDTPRGPVVLDRAGLAALPAFCLYDDR